MTADFVLVAPPERLPGLTALLRIEGTVDAYSDADAMAALDATFRTLPRMVVLERGFAESLRGRAFVRRVTDDPFGRECLVRVIDAVQHAARQPDGVTSPLADTPSDAASGSEPTAEAVTTSADRATVRRPVRQGSTGTIDGTLVQLVDISAEGLQVIGPLTLKPNQAVRVTLPAPDVPVKVHARVAWASLELSSTQARLCYRAGLSFVDADATAITRVVEWLTR